MLCNSCIHSNGAYRVSGSHIWLKIYCSRVLTFDDYIGGESFLLPSFVTEIECKEYEFKYENNSVLDLENEDKK
jgi:hypothetical protein